MKCPKCQTENPDDSKYCKECATSLTGDGAAQASFTKTLETPNKGIIPGTTFAARYKIIEMLGRGGMGVVYKAEDAKLKRTIAIKLLPPELTGDKEARERFIREAQSAAVLDHPNICTIYEVDESDDKTFISMAYVDGQDLRGKVKEGPLEINEALDLAIQAAEGLAAAHSKGIIHRDIKSANIMVTKEGQAKIMDFGLAKFAGASMITREGVTMGTVAYMSPEQAQGKTVDHRSDVWSLGVVLYEMFGGRLPFQGETEASFLYSIVHEEPEPLKEVNPNIPLEIQKFITRALKKKPEGRYQSAMEMADDLRQYLSQVKAEEAGLFSLRTLLRRLRQPKYAIPVVLTITLMITALFWYFGRQAKIQWARAVLMPEVERFIEAGDDFEIEAYKVAIEAEKYLSNDPELEELFQKCSVNISIKTEPPGASLYFKEYDKPDDEWTYIGVSPLRDFRVAMGGFRWKMELEGYEPLIFASSSHSWELEEGNWKPVPRNFLMLLDKQGTIPQGMVRFRGLGETGDFYIDRYEVTNRDYKEFIRQGGYTDTKYWKHSFVKDGKEISWEEAMAIFNDQTGRPGPSTWAGGDYPEERADYPVGGISWYEACAYAEYAEKSLPTAHHWERAAGLDLSNNSELSREQLGMINWSVILSLSNFSNKGPSSVGIYKGMTTFGIYDMAGNVREWCLNKSQEGRVLRGGSWNDIPYMYSGISQAGAFERLANYGFRCCKYHHPESMPDFTLEPIKPAVLRNFYEEKPVSDEIFEIYKNQFSYDPIELNPKIELEEDSSEYWLKQKITFNAAYDNERVPAFLFLPKNSKPPFQIVIYFPGSGSMLAHSSKHLYEFDYNLDFIVKNGRAVLYPIYKGTFERNDGLTIEMHMPNQSHEYSSWLIKWVQDLKRSIDYLETRGDIDITRLAYLGFSWGGIFGAIIPAVEDRLKISILPLGGLISLGIKPDMKALPQSDPINYVSRVKIPTLMMNGRYDIQAFPYEACVKPMYDLLGTPEEDKLLLLYETDHYLPRNEYIKETLNWLDRYFGEPVYN